MLNPVATGPVASGPAAAAPEASPVPAERPAATTHAATTSTTKAVTTANPSYILDLGLNLVVLQYHDPRGVVTSSIPSERQLQAYREGGSSSSAGTHPA